MFSVPCSNDQVVRHLILTETMYFSSDLKPLQWFLVRPYTTENVATQAAKIKGVIHVHCLFRFLPDIQLAEDKIGRKITGCLLRCSDISAP